MAREGLRSELHIAIRKARQNYEPIQLKNIKVGTNGGNQFVDVTIQATQKPEEFKDTIMIVFSDVAAPELPENKNSKKGGRLHSNRFHELEIELQHSREEL